MHPAQALGGLEANSMLAQYYTAFEHEHQAAVDIEHQDTQIRSEHEEIAVECGMSNRAVG